MDYGFSMNDFLFYSKDRYNADISNKFSVALPGWYEKATDSEWSYQYPIGQFMERQGWKVHVSASLEQAYDTLKQVSEICHKMDVPFKYLVSENVFIMRNGKQVDRGYSGKFITCYPNKSKLQEFLNSLEEALKYAKGPYILSDKRWKEGPIYIRYGVFRPSIVGEEEDVKIDELIVDGKKIKDERLPQFVIPEGVEIPKFLKSWLHDENNSEKELPFEILSVIRFSNSGGIYNARLKDNKKEMVLKEARPFTGLDFEGTYSSNRLESEAKALKILTDINEVPEVYWEEKLWEHTFLGIERMEGIPLNRWVTKNYPLYNIPDDKKDYLKRALHILQQLVDLIENVHHKEIFHRDMHLGNVIVDENDTVSLIDWEQAVFSNDNVVEHQIAAPEFRAWGRNKPSEIDWYGVCQIAHHLFLPIIIQSDLVKDYAYQTEIAGEKLFNKLGYDSIDIENFKLILRNLQHKVGVTEDLSERKILKPKIDQVIIESIDDIDQYIDQLLLGFSNIIDIWDKKNSDRMFPVHYYGLDINQGIAYSDIGILRGYYKLWELSHKKELDDSYKKLREMVTNQAVLNMNDEKHFLGLFDGIAGTIWLINEFGKEELARELFCTHFDKLISCTNKNLYNGLTGILLVGLYMLNNGLQNKEIKELLFDKLNNFAEDYKSNPEAICKIGPDESQSNDPYQINGGLLYGHAGIGWLFGEAYRFTGVDIYKECLQVAIESELKGYSVDKLGSLQYAQGERMLPYLSTGSAGLIILIKRNQAVLNADIIKITDSLEKAIDPNFCLFPGLFNGFSGLQIAKNINRYGAQDIYGAKELLEGLSKYLIGLENGVVLAGDAGMRITTDVASGSAGIALALSSIMNNKFDFIPCIEKR
ncbi:class III lanthionine synthetase LanKC [Streptococcus orisasini]|uniref:class III lanthionine synthetase LanKC n=1 Tax=Streptococcus orisasini TaxID=1080071 RepID=UPI00070D3BAA|nr:class III lanthionine synthetase LanKC [Streptococcus orisasini]